MRVVAGVRATQLAVRLALAAVAQGSLELQTAVRQRLTQAGAGAVLGMILIQAVFLVVQALQAWSSLETAEQPLHSQVHLQLQWLAVTLYIRSLATVQ
jgi:hypothetical protein